MEHTKEIKCNFCGASIEQYALNTYKTNYPVSAFDIMKARKEQHKEDFNRFRVDTAQITYNTFIYVCKLCSKTSSYNEIIKTDITFIDIELQKEL
jgi:hypothetical protein